MLSGFLAALIAGENHMVFQPMLPEVISKEPLGPMVRHGDDQWFDIVKWTVYALITAEEFGLTNLRAAPGILQVTSLTA